MSDKSNNARFTLRLPEPTRERIQADATRNGRTETAEIIARLDELPAIDLMQQVLRDNAEIKKMLRQLLHDKG